MITETTKRRSRGWVVFFVLLTALAVTGVTLPIVYNLGQQLKPEQLAAARERWREAGLRDYDLTFSVQYDRERVAERHIVLVRGGRVAFASVEGEAVELSPAVAAVIGPVAALSRGRARDVSAIFDHIEAMPSRGETKSNFLVAVFDPKEGWPRRVVWRLRGTGTREEWNLRVWPAGELDRKAHR